MFDLNLENSYHMIPMFLLTDFFRKFRKRVSENLKYQIRKIPKSPKRQAPSAKRHWGKMEKNKKKNDDPLFEKLITRNEQEKKRNRKEIENK